MRKPPAINFNFLSSPPDAKLTVRAIRVAREIMTAPAMTPLQMSEIAPGADRTTDDEILDWVSSAAETTYHPVGTRKMGSDPMAVVDAQLRVHGITGLRIADASIMPTLTSGNINAPSIMIGERATDVLLNTAPEPSYLGRITPRRIMGDTTWSEIWKSQSVGSLLALNSSSNPTICSRLVMVAP
jgi:choline dehydrogenase-like flavoprotein